MARKPTGGLASELWNALVQRLHVATPSTTLGLASLFFVLTGFVLTPTSYVSAPTALLRPTSNTFPTITVTFMVAEIYVVLLLLCGYWTQRRYRGTPHFSGVAAMKMSLIAGIPVMVGGLLLAFGVIDATFVGLADLQPLPLAVISAPLLRLPESWVWGAIGGWLGGRLAPPQLAAKAL